MRLVRGTFALSVVLVAFLLGACGGDNGDGGSAIAGTYTCEGPEPQPGGQSLPEDPPDPLELQEDGTLKWTLTLPEEAPAEDQVHEGTWSAEEDSGKIAILDEESSFTIEGDRLIFTDHEALATCTKTG